MIGSEFVRRVERLFFTRGEQLYGGEAVTQLEHALQAAELARSTGTTSSDIVAALLHDIGHLLHGHGNDCAERGIDDNHETLGVRFLEKYLPADVTEPVRLHVQAKRYLSATEPAYFATLSPASVTSLGLQGGPMTEAEQREFERHPHFDAAIALRRRDDEAKVVGLRSPEFATFIPHLEACLACAK